VPQAAVNRSVVEVATEVIELNWRDATDIAATFRTFLSDHGSLQANEESQAVIITDVPPQIMRIRELIKQIDRPDRQVIIEARLVDVAIEAVRALGVTWSLANSPSEAVGGIGGGFPDVVGLFNDAFGFSGDSGGVLQFGDDLGFLGSDFDLNAVLNALETRDVVEVLENPRVTTLNNVPANIEIIRRIPYEEVVQGPSDASITREIEFENAGVTITVKPIIAPNGSVRLDMNLNQRIFRSRVGSGALAPPLIDVRNANSTVIVGDRNTVVLGGLRSFRSSDRITGVPWLHRIPFFGWAFKNKGNEQSRTELVLMVTPRIVEQALVTDYEKEYYDRIETKWDLPDYFMDDVRNITDKDGEGN
jgi:type IV pilus assembly protein PilQ